MKRIFKWVLVVFGCFYIISWMVVVPAVNDDLMHIPERCLGKADKIYTPKPSGIELFSPFISYHSKVDMHIYADYPYKSEHNLKTKVYQLIPFFTLFKYKFESQGFGCGGSGKAYLWWGGINIKYGPHWIT